MNFQTQFPWEKKKIILEMCPKDMDVPAWKNLNINC